MAAGQRRGEPRCRAPARPARGREDIPYSKLLLATGARARPWPDEREAALEGVFLLRNVDDALALRAAFAGGPRVAIIGAGFIGCEVAATARKLGLDVTLIEMARHPMPSLGPELGERCAQLHREHGVDLRLGTGMRALHGAGRVEALHLSDDSEVAADVVLVALGAIPNTDWLRDSVLRLQPGVVCDETLAAAGAEDVFCAGDIAAWPHPLADGEVVRIEHWTVAAEQGTAAGRNLVLPPEERRPFTATPYFWSDQYDVKLQSVGFPGRATRMRIAGARTTVAASSRSGTATGPSWPPSGSTPPAACRSTGASSPGAHPSRPSWRRWRPTSARSARPRTRRRFVPVERNVRGRCKARH